MGLPIASQVTMVHFCDCGVCGVPIYGPSSKLTACQRDHNQGFTCINGHTRVFVGKTEAEKLRESLEWEKQRSARLDKQLTAQKGETTKARNKLALVRHRVPARAGQGVGGGAS